MTTAVEPDGSWTVAGRMPCAVQVDHVSKAFGKLPVLVGVSLSIEPGSMVALLGPSGCGKTTLLRIIAGLESPDAGRVTVAGRVLTDRAAGVAVPPESRQIGMVFQDWALFPHLSVARNVAYGLPKRADSRAQVERALAMVGLQGLGDRMPSTLSGGQQQRVALARAIAPAPSVLLLDEPFSNLDTALRVQVRSEVHALLVELGITTIFVTHDQEEAFVLGDQVAVMHDGRIAQVASPAELYRHPADRWVATFVGEANLLRGSVRPVGSAATVSGPAVADTVIGAVPLAQLPVGSREVDVLVRPEQLSVTAPSPVTPATGVVVLIEYYGHDTVYVVDAGGERLRVRETAEPLFGRGDPVVVRYAGGPAMAYPAERE
ncbi:MAG: ABC transporter ATP-binding protein [Acidimicrobiales bacterium]|nr:ABC transporter ATP-binding protein [Acidimicrobiales bacterium]